MIGTFFYVIINNMRKEIKALYKNTIGPMFLFAILYELLRDYALYPLGRLLWGWAISATDEGYISLSNAIQFLKYPQVIIIGLFMIFAYAILVFWQIAVLITYLEYGYQGKSVRLYDIVPLAIKRSSHIFNPSNWMVLLYCLVIIPFVDLYQLTDDFGAVMVPEYIMSVVKQKPALMAAYVVLVIILVLAVVNGLFLLWSFILERKSFGEAVKRSRELTGNAKNTARLTINIVLRRIIASIQYIGVPILVLIAILVPSDIFFGKMDAYPAISQLCINQIAVPVIKGISSSMITVYILCVITILYHKSLNEEDRPVLEEAKHNVKEYKKLGWLARKSLLVTGIVCVAGFCFLFYGTLVATNMNPEFILEFEQPTAVIAHRGYAAAAPPNTLPALDKAIEAKADMVEFDVQATKDGVPVVIHDANAGTITGVNANIASLTLEEVKKLDAGKSFSEEYAGTPIPTLEEWLQDCDHRVILLLEIKNYNDDPHLVKRIMELLDEYGYNDGVSCIIHSGSPKSLKQVKKINPDMPCGLIIAMAVGSYFDVPYADFFSVESTFVSANVVSAVQSRDKFIYAWTVDNAKVASAMFDDRVNGIICDDPKLIGNEVNSYQNELHNYVIKYIKNLTHEADENLTEEIDTTYGD